MSEQDIIRAVCEHLRAASALAPNDERGPGDVEFREDDVFEAMGAAMREAGAAVPTHVRDMAINAIRCRWAAAWRVGSQMALAMIADEIERTGMVIL